MGSITPISILNRIGEPGAPLSLLPGELAYNQPNVTEPNNRSDVLYVGDGASILELVGAARQVELWGDQTITGIKTIDVGNLKITGGDADYLLTTDGNGNISWTNAPGGGLTQVATDHVTLTGLGTPASPLSVVPETVPVAVDGVTIGGNGTSAALHVFANTVAVASDGLTITGTGITSSPLAVVPHSVAIATTGSALTGNGTTASPLSVVANSVPVATNSTLTGNGTTATPLGVVANTVAVATDGITITGTGLTASPLRAVNGTVAVATDGTTIAGSGVTASPLHVVTGGVAITANAPLTGNGTAGSPLSLATPFTLLEGGTGVSASSNANLLTQLGAASAASLANYLPLSGGSLSGALSVNSGAAGSAPAQLTVGGQGISYAALGTVGQNIGFAYSAGAAYMYVNGVAQGPFVALAQLNSAVAAVSTYNATAPSSPNTGALWFNPSTNVLQIWSGSAWVTVVPAPVVTGVTLTGDAGGTGP